MRSDRYAWLIVLVWGAMYGWRGLAGHYALETNAFDLSIFDYALWSLRHGGLGHVPFLGYSIFSQHFMPILGLIAPVYALFESATFLILLQIGATAAAGRLFFVLQRRLGVEVPIALALVAVFLFARRTHSAVAEEFYPESFQALLTFAVVLAWPRGGWRYWAVALCFLSTKEDAAIYLASFALATFAFPFRDRRRAVGTITLASVWFAFALLVAMPASRRADGLSATNVAIAGRYGSTEGQVEWPMLADRLASAHVAEQLVKLVATTGGLSLAGALWLLPALPGIAVNLAADPEAMQSSLSGHYVWPVLPWMFIAAAVGTVGLSRRSRRLTLVWVGAVLAVTLADNPALQRLHRTHVSPDARAVRDALRTAQGASVLAQTNLVPHLRHQTMMFVAGSEGRRPTEPPHVVLLTEIGNTWPMTREEVAAEIRRFETDPAYERLTHGPLHVFRQRPTMPIGVR